MNWSRRRKPASIPKYRSWSTASRLQKPAQPSEAVVRELYAKFVTPDKRIEPDFDPIRHPTSPAPLPDHVPRRAADTRVILDDSLFDHISQKTDIASAADSSIVYAEVWKLAQRVESLEGQTALLQGCCERAVDLVKLSLQNSALQDK